MKLILLKDVAGVGRQDEVVDVKDGYGQNYLIPRKLARFADTKTIAAALKQTAQRALQQQSADKKKAQAVKQLADRTVVLTRPANEQGHLFAAVHEQDIMTALAEQYNVAVSEEAVHITAPIKTVGVHTVMLKNGKTKTALAVEIRAA